MANIKIQTQRKGFVKIEVDDQNSILTIDSYSGIGKSYQEREETAIIVGKRDTQKSFQVTFDQLYSILNEHFKYLK